MGQPVSLHSIFISDSPVLYFTHASADMQLLSCWYMSAAPCLVCMLTSPGDICHDLITSVVAYSF